MAIPMFWYLHKLSCLFILVLHFARLRARSGVHSHLGDHKVSSLGYSLQLYHRVQHRPTVNHNLSQLSPVHNPTRFILIVECGVSLSLQSYLEFEISNWNLTHLYPPICLLPITPTSLSLIYFNNTWWTVSFKKLLIKESRQPPLSSSVSDPNILLSTSFGRNIRSNRTRPSLRVTDGPSQPHKTRGNSSEHYDP